ncbi:hypothetical protein PR048_021009 [Dryococelus australis]|uniref:Uncharacterized protein n=1 Tax=Dryococelus australis TaxID=614101 RepID=A0ABQ9GX22_9NEOP|nr:hypothetical protein PR048_021009 [Dryococelus australis]
MKNCSKVNVVKVHHFLVKKKLLDNNECPPTASGVSSNIGDTLSNRIEGSIVDIDAGPEEMQSNSKIVDIASFFFFFNKSLKLTTTLDFTVHLKIINLYQKHEAE